MSDQSPSKSSKLPAVTGSNDSRQTADANERTNRAQLQPTVSTGASTPNDIPLGVALSPKPGESGTVTARKAGGLRDMGLEVDPRKVGVQGALQHLAKAINIAFQTDYGENYLESVYQAAIVQPRRGADHSPGILRIRRQLVRPVRAVDPLSPIDP